MRAEAERALLADAGGGRLLQPPALEALRRLEAEAAGQGLRLQLVSGFRTVARQRAIFLEALAEQGRARAGRAYTAGEIAAMESVPELVFLNCCHLGAVEVAGLVRRPKGKKADDYYYQQERRKAARGLVKQRRDAQFKPG